MDPIWKDEIRLGELALPRLIPRDRAAAGFCAALFTRMVFSALVDADYLDTEAYYLRLEGRSAMRGQHPPLDHLAQRLDQHLKALATTSGASAVNDLRAKVLDHVRAQTAESESPRSHTSTRGPRLLFRPPDGESSAVRRQRGRAHAARHRCGKGKRRTHEGDARVDQTPIRVAPEAVSSRLALREGRAGAHTARLSRSRLYS